MDNGFYENGKGSHSTSLLISGGDAAVAWREKSLPAALIWKKSGDR
jgi:hypothetical protein